MYAVSTRNSALEKGATSELPAFSSLSGHLRAPVITNERAVPTRRAAGSSGEQPPSSGSGAGRGEPKSRC